MLICLACQGILNPAEIRNHFLGHHKELSTELDLQALFEKEVLEVYPDLTYAPQHPSARVECIYGLEPPMSGYLLCPGCCHCYLSKKTFDKHHCTSIVPSTWTKTSAQRFVNNNSSPWFPVEDPAPPPPLPRDPWTIYKAHSQERTSINTAAALSADYRVLRQFLRKHFWFEKLGDRQHSDLIPLVSYSNKDEVYGTLHKDIQAFLENTQAALKSYYLRRLVSTRPTEERDQTRMSHHRNVSRATHENYARIIAGLIAFIHRVVTNENTPYRFPISSEIALACRELIEVLTPPSLNELELDEEPQTELATKSPDDNDGEVADGDYDEEDDDDDDEHGGNPGEGPEEDEAEVGKGAADGQAPILTKKPAASQASPDLQPKLSHLLFLLFTQLPSGEMQGDFFSPISHYIMLASLRDDQKWAAAGTITHSIAAILFTGRLVFVQKVMKLARDSKRSYATCVCIL